MRTLIIEDEAKLAHAVKDGLEREGHLVSIAPTGEDGFFLIETQQFDLVILDVMLPGRGGLELLSTLRGRGCHAPVLLLTARDSIEDRVMGLDAGADDYLVKPFAFSELLARVRALLRRGKQDGAISLSVADLEIDMVTRRVTRDRVTFEVADNGPGIPVVHQSRIFDRFYRADDSRSSQAGGTGLGLAIAKWALEAQGGGLALASMPGLGCTFQLSLPRAAR